VLAGLLFVPGLATAWTAFQKVTTALVPEALSLSLAGVGAMGVNIACVLLLIRYQRHYGSLVRAAFLSARAHVLTNIAIIGAGLVTGFYGIQYGPM
jgi:Co/Zn/Cd efflux system component